MTNKEYNENQKIPDRIKSTAEGKKIVVDFIDIVRRRAQTDFGDKEVVNFDTKILHKLNCVFFYFTKWIIEYLVDNNKEDLRNSMIWIFTKNDDDCIMSNNILFDDVSGKEYISRWERKLITFNKMKFKKFWRDY